MYQFLPFLLSWAFLLLHHSIPAIASPLIPVEEEKRAVVPSGYAPIQVPCPSTSLVRAANGISTKESAYRSTRKSIASTALASWLKKTNANFVTSGTLPTLGLTTSGGGYRSLLVGAGVIQAFDSRDSNLSTSGLLQAMTYQSGLSGGGWLLSSLVGNNYPTVSYLRDTLWEQAFQDSLLVPANILAAPTAYAEIIADLEAKQAAGYPPTLTDPWGRLLSYQLLLGPDGGVADTFSGVASSSSFLNHQMPYPIITSLGVKTFQGECLPGPNATQYEFHPYEFGSWDAGVAAFTQMAYLGTAVSNGKPSGLTCTANYDNLGYILGTSSSLFNEFCAVLPTASNSSSSDIYEFIASMTEEVHALALTDEYARYPNPFYNYPPSTLVSAQKDLYLVDGGEALQNDPLWPLIHSARALDVIIVNDNSADTSANYPNGSEILTTYVQSITANLTRMPVIPSVDTFIAEGLNTRATFFGCNDTNKITIIFLPNYNFTYPSGQPTSKVEYTVAETIAMIQDGNAVATQGGDKNWPTCLACGIMKKTGTKLPSACTACFAKYCYN